MATFHVKIMIAALLFCGAADAAAPLAEPGAMLREGTWVEDVGAYDVPQAFEKLAPSRWPASGWTKLSIAADHIRSEGVEAPKRGFPPFLRDIVDQVKDRSAVRERPEWRSEAEELNELYLRVPGAQIRHGTIPVYMFKNGTRELLPQLDKRYELTLDAYPFAVTVSNGSRTRNGTPYGDWPRFLIEYGGNSYEYVIGSQAGSSTILAIAELDGDGKPDFLIRVAGHNSGNEAILLSTKARPGKNPPSASLFQIGC
jgi:hypothetical protein